MQTIHYYMTDKGVVQRLDEREKKEKEAENKKILLKMYRQLDKNSEKS